MKIIMLCDFFDEKLEYQENLLAKYYHKHGHEVVIITSTFDSVFDLYSDNHNKNLPAKDYWSNGIHIIKLKYVFNILNRLRRYTNIYGILEREKPDLIYVHDIMLNIKECVRYVRRNKDCKMIMDYHADYSNSGKNWISINILHKLIRGKFYLNPARKYLSKIFPIVPISEPFLREVYGVKDEEMELLPLGTDTDYADQIKQQQEGGAIRRLLNIPDAHRVIFTGGKLTPRKKTELLIGAVQRINDARLHLLIVGDSTPGDQEYKNELLRSIKGNPNIHYLGWQSSKDIYKYMHASDFAVFPSAQSVLWQQSIGMDLPLIVGEMKGQRIEYLNLHDNIVIIKNEDLSVENFAIQIKRLIDSPALLEKMRAGAGRTTAEMLDWNTLIAKTLRFNTAANEGFKN
jgi:1,2-diacylglycerol 3-alpha-glucosyltransferase